MSDAASQVLISRLSGLQARIAQPADRSMVRQLVMADALHMLADVPGSVRSMMVSIQVEGRMDTLCHGRPDAQTLLLGLEARMVGMMTLDWSGPDGVALLDLTVLPGQRRRGLGGMALAALCGTADGMGLPIRATLFYLSDAHPFLSRAGFAVTSEKGTEITLVRPPA